MAEDSPLKELLIQHVAKLNDFYRELCADPIMLRAKVGKGSVKTGLGTFARLRKMNYLGADWLDPFPFDPDWRPGKSKDGLQDAWIGKGPVRAVFCNPPFSFGNMLEVTLLKALAAHELFKVAVAILVPAHNWSAVSPDIKELLSEAGCVEDNLGRIAYTGYPGAAPFDSYLIGLFGD